VKETEIN